MVGLNIGMIKAAGTLRCVAVDCVQVDRSCVWICQLRLGGRIMIR